MTTANYLRLRQICLVAADRARAEADISAVLGSEVVYRDPNVGKYGLENALFPVGQKLIEVVVPTRDGTAAGRFLERFGTRGGYMVIMDCSDVKRRRAHVEALGIPIVNTLDYDGFYAIQMHPRVGRAAILEFNHTRGGDTTQGPYHPAGPGWPEAARLPAKGQLLAVEVESPNPADLAAHWSGIIELPMSGGDQPSIKFDDSEIRFLRCPEGSMERLIGLEIAVPDPEATTQKARARGLVASDGAIWLHGVKIGLRTLRVASGS